MGGITVDDFTSSVAYREIYGMGQQEGLRQGRQAEAAAMTQHLLQRRFGPLASEQQTRIQALPLAELETLADALLDFQSSADVGAWLAQHAS